MKQRKEDKIHSALKRRRLRRARLKKVGITAAILPLVLSKGAPIVYVAARYRRNEDELGIEQVVEATDYELEEVVLPETEVSEEIEVEAEEEKTEGSMDEELEILPVFSLPNFQAAPEALEEEMANLPIEPLSEDGWLREQSWDNITYDFNTNTGELIVTSGEVRGIARFNTGMWGGRNYYGFFRELEQHIRRTTSQARIRRISFVETVTFTSDLRMLFSELPELENIDFGDYFDASHVTQLAWMFSQTPALLEIDLGSWDFGGSGPDLDMGRMFSGASREPGSVTMHMTDNNANASSATSIKFPKISYLNRVTSMYRMFAGARVRSVDLNDWHLGEREHALNMNRMFEHTASLEALDLSGWHLGDGTHALSMERMFYHSGIGNIDFGDNFNVSRVTNMNHIFEHTASLEALDLSGWRLGDGAHALSMARMFYRSGIASVDFGTHFNLSRATNIHGMFARNSAISSLDLSGWHLGSSDLGLDMSTLFYSSSVSTVNFGSSFDVSRATSTRSMFAHTNAITEVDLSAWELGDGAHNLDMSAMFTSSQIASVNFGGNFNATRISNMSNMFNRSPISNLKFESEMRLHRVADLAGMFRDTPHLQALDLSNWDLGADGPDLSMDGMFRNKVFTTLTFGDNFDLSRVTNMHQMFAGAQLQDLDLSGWRLGSNDSDLSMSHMFDGAQMTSINFGTDFNLTRAVNMLNVMRGMRLTDLDPVLDVSSWHFGSQGRDLNLSGAFVGINVNNILFGDTFDLSRARDISRTLSGIRNIESLDLSSWQLGQGPRVLSMINLFNGSHFETLILGEGFDTSRVEGYQAWPYNWRTGRHGVFYQMPNLKNIYLGSNSDILNMGLADTISGYSHGWRHDSDNRLASSGSLMALSASDNPAGWWRRQPIPITHRSNVERSFGGGQATLDLNDLFNFNGSSPADFDFIVTTGTGAEVSVEGYDLTLIFEQAQTFTITASPRAEHENNPIFHQVSVETRIAIEAEATPGTVDIGAIRPGDWGPGGENDERYWSFNNNVLNIYDGAEVTVTGTVNNGRHIVVHGDVDLTILDLNIGVGQSVTPLGLLSGRVNLTLKGQNHLEAADGWAGLQVHPQANLIISGDGYLTAIGGRYGAGIGGSMHARTPGPIRINSGTITAQGGHEGAGIGSAANNGWTAHNGGNITITGGSVNATGGHAGAGIGGGGHGGSGGNITISGGNVRAISYHNGSGIGGGWGGGTAAHLAISGGTVYARANGFDYANGPQGIGAGNTGQRNSGSFTLSNNAVVFAHAPNPDNRVNNHNLDMNQGLLFRGEQGRVYGAFTPVNNFTVHEDWTVRVPNGNSLTVSEGHTLINGGQLIPELGATITIEDGATIKGNRISGAPVREFERDELNWVLLNESMLRMTLPDDLLSANTGQILEFQLVDGESQTTGWQRELDFNISDLQGDDFTLQVRSQANVHFQAGIPSTANFTLDRENDWQENLVTNRIDFALFDRDAEERIADIGSWFAFADDSRRDEFDFYHENGEFNVEADVLHFSNDFEGSYEITARHRVSGQSATVMVHIITASSQPILVTASELADMPEDILERFVSVTLGNGETLPEDIKVEVTASDRDKFVSVEEDKLNFQFENALIEAIDGANISDNRQHKVMVGDENLRFKVSEVSQEDLESAIQLYQLNLESEGGFKELTGEDKSYKLDFDQDQVQALLESDQAGSFTVDFAFGDPVLTRGTSSRQGSGQLTIELLEAELDHGGENNQENDNGNNQNNQEDQNNENETDETNGEDNQNNGNQNGDNGGNEDEEKDETLNKDKDDSDTQDKEKLARAEQNLPSTADVAGSAGLLGLGALGAALALRKKKKK